MEKIERTQYQAALAITGTWQSSNRSKLYKELEWETLSDRRWCRRILQVHKIKNNNRRRLYRCNNSNIFQEIRCKTSRYKNSFFPDAINLWNIIITNFKNVPPFASLKAHIPSLIRPKAKSIFGVHDPLGLRYIFQLRVNLSPLRNHKTIFFLISLLRFVNVIKILKILAIFYLHVLVLQIIERTWQLRLLKFREETT